ncbi:hypothetical protein KIPB_006812, partial [Kipferlia bialata]
LAGDPTSEYDGVYRIKFPLVFSPFNQTAWPISSEYGPVDTSGPAAYQLEMLLSALAVRPYMDEWMDRNAPNMNVEVTFIDWTATYPILQAPESIAYCMPLVDE